VTFRNRIWFLQYQCNLNHDLFFLCWCNVLRWIWCLWCYSECISTQGRLEKYAWNTSPIIFIIFDTIFIYVYIPCKIVF
jgi:hypothetical protein